MATYASLAIGKKAQITMDFFKQCKDKTKSLKQLVIHAALKYVFKQKSH
jgi:hypothetical protein